MFAWSGPREHTCGELEPERQVEPCSLLALALRSRNEWSLHKADSVADDPTDLGDGELVGDVALRRVGEEFVHDGVVNGVADDLSCLLWEATQQTAQVGSVLLNKSVMLSELFDQAHSQSHRSQHHRG